MGVIQGISAGWPAHPLLVALDLLSCLGKTFQSWDHFLEGGGWIEIPLLPWGTPKG